MATQNMTRDSLASRMARVSENTPAAVVETVDRCYRIMDTEPRAFRRDDYTNGRLDGYTQTLALLLGTTTRQVGDLLRERAL